MKKKKNLYDIKSWLSQRKNSKKKKKSDNIVFKGYYIHINSTNILKERKKIFRNEMVLKLIFHNEKNPKKKRKSG
jgi:hypothetical protein